MESVIADLRKIMHDENALRLDEPMSQHTTFGVGGEADFFIDVASDELRLVTGCLREHQVPITVIGNGSNLLVSDKGIRGAVICIGKRMNEVTFDVKDGGGSISCAAGALLPSVAKKAADRSLTGLEFATGIPGTIGGAVYMNAGAFGGDMSEVITAVTSMTEDGEARHYSNADIGFGYRSSIFSKKKEIITGATLAMPTDDPTKIKARIAEIKEKRAKSQPIDKRSAGSTFRKVGTGDAVADLTPAWKLIQQAGMKDAHIGGARVSEKHSGFVINEGTASAMDIYNLIQEIISKVQSVTGTVLEPEVKLVGEFR